MTQISQQRRHVDTIFGHTQSVPGLPRPVVNELIGRSWRRCLQDYGLDPGRAQPARIVTQQTLREHQEAMDELIRVARAGVEQFYSQIANLGYVLLLSDYRGVTVQFLGDNKRDARLRKAGLYLGADWGERHAGTCAVGTCIQEQQALTCHRMDHFDTSHISLTCTAAPIRDPNGHLMAVLDISALDSTAARDSQNFALHLTRLYARMIEDAYFLRHFRRQLIVRCDTSREFVQVNGRLLFAAGEDGQILAANSAARTLLERAGHSSGTLLDLPGLLSCQWSDLLSVPSTCDDGVRAFESEPTEQILYATLIEPVKHTMTTQPSQEEVPELDELAADDPAMRKTLSLAKRLRNRDVSVLLLGETGTGKEVLAQALHRSSHRSDGPFVAVNCSAIPESLIESELFGYAPGAFTGGRSRGAPGLIQQAHGGTLFLDEIGDMPLVLQTRLLRVLAEGEVMPLGSHSVVSVDCRVIAATHCDLSEMIGNGHFRADLFYRLNGASLRLPALRDRTDREYVIQVLLQRLSRRVRLRADAMSALLGCSWPGNIRQLSNALAFAEATCDGDEITVNDLPEECLPDLDSGASEVAVAGDYSADQGMAGLNAALHTVSESGACRDAMCVDLMNALRQFDWNISEVARTLSVSRPTVYRRIRKYGVRRVSTMLVT